MKEGNDIRLQKYIWLCLKCGVDSVYPFRIYSSFGDIDKAYAAENYEGLMLPDGILGDLLDKRLNQAFEILKRCRALGIRIICIDDSDYPVKLKKIKDPPLVLYCKGRLINMDTSLCVGMVGTRKVTDYGEKTAEYLAGGVASSGAVVISGLAKGIDGICHRASLGAGGFTVGVIGNSIDTIYPKENASLFNKVYKYGLVISEYWPGCKTGKQSFPRRNRIIAGLSDIVVVVEAPAGSGALITASHAIKSGKPVCVPPMPLTEENAGTASLLRGGARLITGVEDLLNEYESVLPHKIAPDIPLPSLSSKDDRLYEGEKGIGESEKELAYNFLLDELEKNGPETLEQAARATTRFSLRELMLAATSLELDGFIVKTVGGRYDSVPVDIKITHKEQ
ncbi:MAG: DNA-processing protein DprA [Clostridia bacterium]|nr:DNA-processing protein DprA [Clostridia bacterium]